MTPFLALNCYNPNLTLHLFHPVECVLPLKPAVTPFGTQRGKIKTKVRLLAKAYNDSPMFVQEGPHGTSILYIPSVFISYNGEALDEKSVLLRSCEAIEKVALDVLQTITPQEGGTKKKPRFVGNANFHF